MQTVGSQHPRDVIGNGFSMAGVLMDPPDVAPLAFRRVAQVGQKCALVKVARQLPAKVALVLACPMPSRLRCLAILLPATPSPQRNGQNWRCTIRRCEA
jgi:hypothetical protein